MSIGKSASQSGHVSFVTNVINKTIRAPATYLDSMIGTIIFAAVGLVILIALAKPRRGRRFGRYIKGNIDLDFALGTLAPQDVLIGSTQDQVNGRTLVSSVVATYTLSGYTVTDNVGPIMMGIAHPDYADAEIEAWIENATGWDEGDKISQEIAKRLIRRIGMFTPQVSLGAETLNEGRPIKTKLNWILNQGTGLKFWVYNHGTVAVGTTDPDVHVDGHANLWPR